MAEDVTAWPTCYALTTASACGSASGCGYAKSSSSSASDDICVPVGMIDAITSVAEGITSCVSAGVGATDTRVCEPYFCRDMDWGSGSTRGSTTPLTAAEGCVDQTAQLTSQLTSQLASQGCSAAGDATGLSALRACKTSADVDTCGEAAIDGVSPGCAACILTAAASAGMTDATSLTPEIIVRSLQSTCARHG